MTNQNQIIEQRLQRLERQLALHQEVLEQVLDLLTRLYEFEREGLSSYEP